MLTLNDERNRKFKMLCSVMRIEFLFMLIYGISTDTNQSTYRLSGVTCSTSHYLTLISKHCWIYLQHVPYNPTMEQQT